MKNDTIFTMKLLYFITALFFILFLGIFYWVSQPSKGQVPFHLANPLPSGFYLFGNKEVATLDVWSPNVKDVLAAQDDFLNLSAISALSLDTTTQKVLYSKDPTRQLPMASLTKIMTAIIALEHPKKDDKYFVRTQSLVGNDSMGLSVGEVLSLSDLLYGLLLPSGNDAAETLADNYPGGRNAFITAMNEKVKALGLTHTHFSNPSGLEGDGDQHTTAYDLLVETNYTLTHFPKFAQVVATYEEDIPATDTHKEYDLFNETNLLTSYPGVKGVKDGYTPEAGLCLITYLDYKDHKILAVILGSNDRRGEMKEVLDYSLKKLGITPPHHG